MNNCNILVRVPRINIRANGSEDVRRRGKQQRDGAAVSPRRSQSADNRGIEVREAVRSRDANVHQGQNPELGVHDTELQSLPDTSLALIGGRTVGQNAGSCNLAHIFRH